MIYDEFGSGGMGISGCAVIGEVHIYVVAYSIGDVLFNVAKANKGVLEKVVVKEIVPCNLALTNGQFRALYRDTLNGLWNEDDLVSWTEAKTLIQQYYAFLQQQYNTMANGC